MVIDLERFRRTRDKSTKSEKDHLWAVLESLFWENPKAYAQLCAFCQARKNKFSPGIKRELIKKGLLNRDGSLPDITNEIVYEATMGQKPYWLHD